MNKQELKQLLKEAVREVFQEEIKNIVMEAIKSNKQSLTENTNSEVSQKTFNSNFVKSVTQPIQPTKPVKSGTEIKQSYISILEDMSKGPKSGFEGEFEVPASIDPMSGTLPDGQLSLNQIMSLTQGK